MKRAVAHETGATDLLPPVIRKQSIHLSVSLAEHSLIGTTTFDIRLPQRADFLQFCARHLHVQAVRANGNSIPFDYPNDWCGGVELEDVGGASHALGSFLSWWREDAIAICSGDLSIDLRPLYVESDKEKEEQEISFPFDITVEVDFAVFQPKGGVIFSSPDQFHRFRAPHMYVDHQPLSACFWVPCVLSLEELHPYEIVIICEDDEVAVCSGVLERFEELDRTHKRVFQFKHDYPIHISSVFVSVGKFVHLSEPQDEGIAYFCLPGREDEMKATVQDFPAIVSEITKLVKEEGDRMKGSEDVSLRTIYPYISVVFVHDMFEDFCTFSGCLCVSARFLHKNDTIEAVMKATKTLALAFSTMLFNSILRIGMWSDMWLAFGLSHAIASIHWESMYGNNQVEFWINCEAERLHSQSQMGLGVALDEGENFVHPVEMILPDRRAKSQVVMHVIRTRCGLNYFLRIVRRLLYPAMTQYDRREKNNVCLVRHLRSVDFFLLLGRGDMDLKGFKETWILGRWIPTIECLFTYNEDTQRIELAAHFDAPVVGTLSITVTDLKGNTSEHLMSVEGEYEYIQFETGASAASIPPKRRKKTDGSSFDLNSSSLRTDLDEYVSCVRVDPGREWIRKIVYGKQSQGFSRWKYIIQEEIEDGVAHIEAIRGLAAFNDESSSWAFLKGILIDRNVFYGARIEAARALAEMGQYAILVEFMRSEYFIEHSTRRKPNDFSNVGEYFLQRELPKIIASIRGLNGATPPDVADLLFQMLQFNDNSGNEYSDCHLVASLIEGICMCQVDHDSDFESKAFNLVKEQLDKDVLVPSYENTITKSCLRALEHLVVNTHKKEKKIEYIDSMARYMFSGNHPDVRLLSCSLLLKRSYQFDMSFYTVLLGIVKENCRYTRWHLCQTIHDSSPHHVDFEDFRDYLRQKAKSVGVVCERIHELLRSSMCDGDPMLRFCLANLYGFLYGVDPVISFMPDDYVPRSIDVAGAQSDLKVTMSAIFDTPSSSTSIRFIRQTPSDRVSSMPLSHDTTLPPLPHIPILGFGEQENETVSFDILGTMMLVWMDGSTTITLYDNPTANDLLNILPFCGCAGKKSIFHGKTSVDMPLLPFLSAPSKSELEALSTFKPGDVIYAFGTVCPFRIMLCEGRWNQKTPAILVGRLDGRELEQFEKHSENMRESQPDHVMWAYMTPPPNLIVDLDGSEVQVSLLKQNEPATSFYRECFGTLDGTTVALEPESDHNHVFIECPDLSLRHESWTPTATAERNSVVLHFVGDKTHVILVTGENFSRSSHVIGQMKRPLPPIVGGIGKSVSIRRPYVPLVIESTGGNRLNLDIIDCPTSTVLLVPFHSNVDFHFDYGMLYGNVSEKSDDLQLISEAVLAGGKGVRRVLHEGEVALSVLQGQLQIVLAIGDIENHVTYLTEPGVLCGFIVEDIGLVRERVQALQIGEIGIACTLSPF